LGGRSRVVATALDAMRLMVKEWPVDDGPALHAAEMACLDVFNEAEVPEEARKKFLAAAKEAHLVYLA